MPASFAKSPNGRLYTGNGIDPVLRWDGIFGAMEPAGVIAPAAAISITGSGVGDIFGTIYAFVRYYDRLGLFSNVSPASASYKAVGLEKTITAASNTSPIVITTAGHTLQTGDKIRVENVTGNTAANGTWTVTNIDTDTFSLDGSLGNDDYRSGGTWHRGVATITYSDLPVSDEPKVLRRQIFRTKTGDPNTVFLDLDTTDLTSDTLSSTSTDAELTSGAALIDINGDDFLTSRHGIPPSDKSVFVHHIDRMFAVVDVSYDIGNVQVTNGSPTVVGVGTEWSDEFVGRYLYTSDATTSYLISAVDLDAQTLTLSENYVGTSSKYATYAIRPDEGKRRTVRWSESGLPESWDIASEFGIQENKDSGQLVGGMSLDSWLYIVAENRIYRYSYQKSPLVDGFVFPDIRRGMVNHQCWVQVDDSAYMMDRQGIYKYFGNGQQEVSQQIQEMFGSDAQGPYQINWDASEFFHAGHDPINEVVMFFVALDGDYLPRHAICLDYRTQALWLQEYPIPIGATTIGQLDGRAQLYLGADHCRVLASGLGNLDGVDPLKGTVQGTVTSSGPNWIVDSTASFGADCVNDPLVIASGKGAGQRRRITSVTSTRIDVAEPWLIQPDTTSTFVVGGIEFVYRTGWFRYLQRDTAQNRRVELLYSPTEDEGHMQMEFYEDQSSVPLLMQRSVSTEEGSGIATEVDSSVMKIKTDKVSGYVDQSLSEARWREVDGRRWLSVKISGVQSKDKIKVFQMGLYGERR